MIDTLGAIIAQRFNHALQPALFEPYYRQGAKKVRRKGKPVGGKKGTKAKVGARGGRAAAGRRRRAGKPVGRRRR